MNKTRIVYRGGQAEIIEKKSRFIATVTPVHSQEEALSFIAAQKKKYWDATHNCYAYIIGQQGREARCSDDGEPQGTAGRPMLDVLQGEDVYDICVVVTRYFGGTLLGTGGLVRAYSRVVQEGLAASAILKTELGYRLLIRTDYTGLGKIQYLLGERGLKIINSSYGQDVELETLVPEDLLKSVKENITEATSGRAVFEQEVSTRYAFLDQEPIFL
ncbi:MAG: YigZ family protein [Lachnospiraceae bacterium]|nr:YigZ family protein [Lachnospiraceae bacterium]